MARQAASETPYVSVIVLVYNEVDSVEPLHRELIGVLEGLGTSFEVIYVDDGSRDGSTEKLGQLASRDGRVRVVSFRRNFGRRRRCRRGSTTAAARCWSSSTATCRTTRTTSLTSSPRSTRATTWSAAGAATATTPRAAWCRRRSRTGSLPASPASP